MYLCNPGVPCPERHTYTTRNLFTVLPSENYAPGGRTQDGLLKVLVDDLISLEQNGIQARFMYIHGFCLGAPVGKSRFIRGLPS